MWSIYKEHVVNKINSIFNNLDPVIAQPLSKKIDQAGNQKHIINFFRPNDEGIGKLMDALKQNSGLEKLDLSDGFLKPSSGNAIGSFLRFNATHLCKS